MFELRLFGASIEDIFDKLSKIQRSALVCSFSEDFLSCWDEQLKNMGVTFNTMKQMGVGEFDPSIEDILIDGIVVDEDKAKSTPCKCVVVDGKELCWSPGIIGMLRQDQIEKYCPVKKYEEAPKLKEHLLKFREVAKKTRGLPLAERIKIMRKELEEKASEDDDIFEELSDEDFSEEPLSPSLSERENVLKEMITEL